MLDNGADGTLRKEIADANNAPGTDTIVFKIPAASLPGTIILGAAGEIPITDTLTVKGPGVDLVSVSGSDVRRIFNINDGTAAPKPAAISGLTLTDGWTATYGGAVFSNEPLALKNVVIRSSYAGKTGGGAYVRTAGKVSVANSLIVHNEAADNAGGLLLWGDAGVSVTKTTLANNTSNGEGGVYAVTTGARSVILIDNCIIANNIATYAIPANGGSGGGIRLYGEPGGKLILKNSLITGNSAGYAGGGLYLTAGNLLVTRTVFSGNSAPRGGALAGESNDTITISGSRFVGNSATAGFGGGAIFLDEPSVSKLTGSVFSGNTSAGAGGAITGMGLLSVTISGSNFLGNTSGFGGGALAIGDGATLNLKSSVLSGNSAADGGGAIVGFDGSILNLTGNKFTENRATNGGALYLIANPNASTANISNNLFQGNVADNFGGAIRAVDNSVFTSKADKFIGNVAMTGQGGGVHLVNTGGIAITGSIFQSNVAGSSGGGLGIAANATLTGLKVRGNIAGSGGRGGGIRIAGGTVLISNSFVTGNVANDGGGIFFNLGTTTLTNTLVNGNAAGINPNIGSA